MEARHRGGESAGRMGLRWCDDVIPPNTQRILEQSFTTHKDFRMKDKTKKKRKRKDTTVQTENRLGYNGVYYKVNTIICVNNDPDFGG